MEYDESGKQTNYFANFRPKIRMASTREVSSGVIGLLLMR
jgi:hypothetical protein